MSAHRTDAGRGKRRGTERTRVLATLGLWLLTAGTTAAAPTPRWASVSLLAGSAQPVAGMADYQWDIRPHAAWGAQLMAGRGPVATGLRWWRGGTTQVLGLAGVSDPGVRTGSIELLGQARLAHWRAAQLLATASGGRLAITYHPDRLTIVTGGTPVEVALAPLHEWVGGAGLAVHMPITGGWQWGFETERRMFSLDTAHRSGTAVTLARETFGDWDTRIAVARAWNW